MPIISGGSGGGTGAWALITDTTLGADTPTFDFSGIAATFSHLVLMTWLRSDLAAANDTFTLRFNNDSTANYWYEELHAAAASPASAGVAGATALPQLGFIPANTANAGSFAGGQTQIPNYANATANKLAICTSYSVHALSSGNQIIRINGMNWVSNSAVTRITLLPTGGANFKSGSRATLYGLT